MNHAPPADQAAFEFGKNWKQYLASVTPDRIEAAQHSMQFLLQTHDLNGKTFLDAGSGSGMFSLAAHRLGAHVTSFDVDPDSVACTEESKRRFAESMSDWIILSGSLLDEQFLVGLRQYDIVYCWGVAHHTGDLWRAMENLLELVNDDGTIVLAIYNDQQYISSGWHLVKRIYQKLPVFVRPGWVIGIGIIEFSKRFLVTLLASLLRIVMLRNPLTPFVNWATETRARGMNGWHDLVDWIGGWPFEVATPERVFRFARDRGFQLEELITSSGHGCNEFTFKRIRPLNEQQRSKKLKQPKPLDDSPCANC